MNALPLDQTVRLVLGVLFNGLWVAALLAIVAWVALRAMPKANATTRHSILAAAFLASLVLPVATALGTAWLRPPASASVVSQKDTIAVTRRSETRGRAQSALAPLTSAALPRMWRPSISLPRPAAIALALLWLAGALFVLARLLVSLLHLERLKRDALPLPVEYRSRLSRWTTAAKGARPVRLCRSNEIEIPIAVGLFDAMILVPEHLVAELAPEDVDRMILHELAHLRRGDDWLNAVERVAQALLFFNPGILWLVGQLDLEREVACDDWVIQQTEVISYATCLARVAETAAWPHRAMAAPGAFVTRRGMSIRIERLLAAKRDVRIRTSLGPAGVAIAALGTLCVVAAFVSPSIAYTVPPQVRGQQPALVRPDVRPEKARAQFVPQREPAPGLQRNTPTPTPSAASLPMAAHVNAASSPAPAASHQVAHAAARPPQHTIVHKSLHVAAHGLPQTVERAAVVAATTIKADTEQTLTVAANSPDYIDELASVGYTNLTMNQLIQLHSVGVTAAYIRELAAAGISHPPVNELVRLRAIGVDGPYISAMRARYGAALSLDDITEMRAVGVDAAYADELARVGYPNLSANQIRQMRAMDIDAAFVQKAAAHGFRHLSVEDLIRLKASDVL
jgi:beta-lactamase regulating signal transducer with metallopeptidase domain